MSDIYTNMYVYDLMERNLAKISWAREVQEPAHVFSFYKVWFEYSATNSSSCV